MDKHLLLTISDDQSSAYKLRFIRNFFSDFCNLNLTLLAVTPVSYHRDPVLYPEQAELTEANDPALAAARRHLDYARSWTIGESCPPDRVRTKILPARGGTVETIVTEAVAGLYDAVVVGRRGLGWVAELVEDSVSHKLLWQNIDFPVWVCAGDIEVERRDVLLCVDGSEPSVRIADHVGFILGPEAGHQVTLIYVTEAASQATKADEARLEQAVTALLDNDFPEDRIRIKITRAANPAEAILAEAESGRYAVVAAGRRSDAPTGLKRILPWSVSTRLLRELSRFCLWISK